MPSAAGTTYLRKDGIAVLPIVCVRAPNPLPLCLPTPLYYGSNYRVVPYVLGVIVGYLSKHQNKASDTDSYKG